MCIRDRLGDAGRQGEGAPTVAVSELCEAPHRQFEEGHRTGKHGIPSRSWRSGSVMFAYLVINFPLGASIKLFFVWVLCGRAQQSVQHRRGTAETEAPVWA